MCQRLEIGPAPPAPREGVEQCRVAPDVLKAHGCGGDTVVVTTEADVVDASDLAGVLDVGDHVVEGGYGASGPLAHEARHCCRVVGVHPGGLEIGGQLGAPGGHLGIDELGHERDLADTAVAGEPGKTSSGTLRG